MPGNRKRNYETKRMAGKGEKKWRTCLGSDCEKKIFTTMHTRLCQTCKNQLDKMDSDYGHSLTFRKQ